ncbi:MAG: hypothetical protein NXI24_10825 [bacterium]|nr:hypothetical protein [bacterium]
MNSSGLRIVLVLIVCFAITCDRWKSEDMRSGEPPGYHDISIDPETGDLLPKAEPSTIARIRLAPVPEFSKKQTVIVTVENIQEQPIFFNPVRLAGPQIAAADLSVQGGSVYCAPIVEMGGPSEAVVTLKPGETTEFEFDFSFWIRSCQEQSGSRFRTGKYELSLSYAIDSELVESEKLTVSLSGN